MEAFEKTEARIPIVVGITGHRNLRGEDQPGLYAAVCTQLRALRGRHPTTPVTVLSSLAEGADQLCAKAALETGCTLIVPLPMEQAAYLEDFSPEGAALFGELLAKAQRTFVVPAEEPPPPDAPRGFYYRQAGIYVATHSHILLALWDGAELRTPEGGGTFETVRFMLEGDWSRTAQQDTVYFKTPQEGVVWHLPAVRADQVPPAGQPPTLRVLPEGAPQWPPALAETERFNRDARQRAAELEKHRPQAEAQVLDAATIRMLPPHPRRLLALFATADGLSLHYRKLRLRVLGWLSGLGTLLVLVFLLYDEMESDLMLPLYAVLLVAAFAVYIVGKRREYHERYIHYRLLAEALRVQLYWEAAGVRAKVWEQYTWAQKDDIIWVKEALAALDLAPPVARPPLENAIPLLQKLWIDGQHSYHQAARVAKERRLARNRRTSAILLALTVLLFAVTFGLEFFAKDWALMVLPTQPVERILMMHEGQDITVRGLVKILLGAVAAGTALLSNYFSKLSLPVQARDNARMAGLYAMAQERLARLDPVAERPACLQLLFHLGREAVVENGNWLLDYLEQSPDIVL